MADLSGSWISPLCGPSPNAASGAYRWDVENRSSPASFEAGIAHDGFFLPDKLAVELASTARSSGKAKRTGAGRDIRVANAAHWIIHLKRCIVGAISLRRQETFRCA